MRVGHYPWLWVWLATTSSLAPSSLTEHSDRPLTVRFTAATYRATIAENSPGRAYVTPSSVEKMGVYLPPQGTVTYRIVAGDSDRIFKAEERVIGNFFFLLIRTRTGNSVVLNRERKDSFVLQVKATLSLERRVVENTTEVTVSVSDRNDLRPLFYQTSYQVVVPEDARIHTSVVRIHAEDADLGRGGEVYYRLREPSSSFAIHPVTGVVTLTRPLRAAERRTHDLTVWAQDRGDGAGSPPSAARLTVTVRPVNLHNPEVAVNYPSRFYENSDTNVYAIVTVTDKDTGRSGEIDRLEITDGDSNGHFRVKRVRDSNGTTEYNVVTYKILNRERYSKQYNLTLRAVDRGEPPRQAFRTLDILVEPSPDKYPIFEKEIYEVDILESAPTNSPIIRLKIADNEQIYNEVHLEIVGGNEGGVFRINPHTGMLYTADALDAEEKNLYTLTVSALEQGKAGFIMQSSAKVKVHVVDINDNDPIFETPAMELTVTENEPAGTSIARVVARDKDSGENGYISYSIANLNAVPVEIDHFTGIIRTIETLDYETMRRESSVYVRASDWGLPFRRETEMELKIRLRDVNDNRPQFERVNCSGSLSRFATLGSEIMSLTAIDFDSGNIISYRIVSKNSEGCFSLGLTSGILSVTCDLKNENFTEKILNTTATDGVHFAEINPIRIRLVNDKPSRSSFDADNFVCNETGVARQLKETLSLAAKSNTAKSPDHRDIAIMPKRYGENVHAPEILNLPATVQINESVALGSKVMRIQATDRDLGYNGKLVFGLISGDRDSLFRLDPETGILKTIGRLDYEKETEYVLTIMVYDLGKPQKSSTGELTIVILDSNDNPPRFQQPMASLNINENTANGTAIFKAIATDLDSTENAQISYYLVTETDLFVIDPSTGVLYVNTPPDRERGDSYEVRVGASDGTAEGALRAESVVLIHINDANDNAPMFSMSALTVNMKEDMPVGSVVAILEAVDGDLGVNGEVVYSLPGNTSFAVDELSGELRLATELDYEERQQHEVTVAACDRGTPPLCASAVVEVRVVDVDENTHAPRFADWVVSTEVAENQPSGTVVIAVNATDDDPPGEDSRLAYYIAGGNGVGYFSIDDHGLIRTTAPLDAEAESHYWLTVLAQDHGVAPLSARLEVYVFVRNLNDNAPLSEEPVYQPRVAEDSPANTHVLRVTAHDEDRDPAQSVTFSITAGNADGCFEIDRETGVLTTTRNKLDREQQTEHDLEITIADNGSPPLVSTTRVLVLVDDVNDNAPQFEQSYYHVTVPHNTRHKQPILQIEEDPPAVELSWDQFDKSLMAEPLLRVLAVDKDAGANADIEYSIKAGRGKGRFTVHPQKGVIYSHKSFSAGQEFDLTVKATDHGFPNKSSTARIAIQVVAVPEGRSPPSVKTALQSVEVTEADPVGFLVAMVQAAGHSDHLWFRIADGDPRGDFVMGGDPGSVLLARQLDYETQDKYNLTIAVHDGVHTVFTQLLVSVLDTNEFRPSFSETLYVAMVTEAAEVGSEVTRLRAEDEDRGSELVYDLLNARSPASLDLFRVDHQTGAVTLAAPLDRELATEHLLTVVARDQATPTKRGYARLALRVADSNNHAPTWGRPLLQAHALQTAQPGTALLRMLAADRDHGDNAAITYSIVSGNIGAMFSVEPRLGTLMVAGRLEGARLGEYMLTVQATDGGSPALSATVPVHVLVTKADNTAPRFSSQTYTVDVFENERAGSLVLQLEPAAGTALYYELRGDTSGAFAVNPATGTVTTRRPLDRETQDWYNLTVTAAASNAPGARAECSVFVNVLDRNDNPPRLSATSYEAHVPEDSPTGTLVMVNETEPLVILATDADSQTNALLRFKILEPTAARMFYIDGFTGTVRTRSQLDYETMKSVTFTVRVSDLGSPRLTCGPTARVRIIIQDVNDCVPRFHQPEYSVALLPPPYPQATLLQVAASDEDSAPVTSLRYTVLTGNTDGWCLLDPETGVLSVHGLLRSPHPPSHTLRVAVSDGRYSAQARVTIHWLKEGSALLAFQHAVYQGFVTENSTRPVTVAVVSVIGSELNQHIRFRIANPSPLFRLGLTSGALVTTGLPFDRELQDRYTVYVQAEFEDGDGVRRLTQTLVNITVADVNDNCPVFLDTPYIAAVTVGAQKHTPFIKVLAVDADEGEQGEVRYELTRGHGELFRVDRRTGEVSLKQALQAAPALEAYTLTITAYDGGVSPCSSEVPLVVRVLSQAAPQFERLLYSVSVPESLPPHSLLPLRLTAQAPFSHPVIYSIPDPDASALFSVDVTAGALFTEVLLDYESSPELRVRVRATDTLTGETADVEVVVQVTDVNDNPPHFPLQSYNLSLPENTPLGALLAVIKAEDRDSGLNAQLQYAVLPLHGAVRVDPVDGSLFLQQPLDRERNSSLLFTLTATDSGVSRFSTSVDVWIQVVDVNDNPPRFERPSYECRVSEEAARGQLVCGVLARDPDLDSLRYAVVAGNPLHSFAVHPASGIISVMNTVHLGQAEPHVLNVSVSDGVHTRFCRVSVRVLPTHGRPPLFPASQLEAGVSENLPAGAHVTTVKAAGAKLTYSIPSEYMRSMFHIHHESGEMTTAAPLDREHVGRLEVQVLATDLAGWADSVIVRVTVTDVNDHPPTFHFPEYHACISPNLSVDSVFLKVQARDKDSGPAGLVEYSIYNLQTRRVKHLFGINPQSGSIVLLQATASYAAQHFQFWVRASDNGVPPLFSDVPVTVYVTRPGDTPPTFHRRDQHVFVSEDAVPGTVVTQVKLVEPMTVEYILLTNSSQFAIDSEGVVKVTAPLDHEEVASYTLGVLASRPPLTGFTELHVIVVDVNDTPPRFHGDKYRVRVAEDVPEGTPIVRVVADDPDEGGGGEVRYSLDSAFFTVDPYSGWVSTLALLDRETIPRHEVLLTASDLALSSTATLVVELVDREDSPPVFQQESYTTSVPEDAAVGSTLLTLTAVDADGSTLDWLVTAGDPRGQFAVRPAGHLALMRPLDREVCDRYDLRVAVTDSKHVVETDVTLLVTDVNDNRPQCLQPRQAASVMEDVSPGSTVLSVRAVDADLLPQLMYSLTGAHANHFYIHQSSGELKTAVALDRESVPLYSLVAHVQDGVWECTSHVTVEVGDVNDHVPSFTAANYTAAVPEDYPPGSFVTILHATDNDTGVNGKVRYTVAASEGDYFTVEPSSGLVQVARPLDRGLRAQYTLTVRASDGGKPPLTTTASLRILVVDVNDDPPEFTSRSYHAVVSEAAALGSVVTTVSAVSLEDGAANLVYSIIAGNEFGKFAIEPQTDRIVVAEPLDYEEAQQYLLTVLATDTGEHPLSTHTAVNISVTDINDNPPTFSQPSYSADVSELSVPGHHVIQVSASDLDSGVNGLVRYSLVGGRSRVFNVDELTGLVTLARTAALDREQVDSYVLRVQARDGGLPCLSSVAVVHVTVTDANDNPPVFVQPNMTAILQEDKPAGWAVCQLAVTDADISPNTAPFIYEILYDDSGGKFRIDSKGVLQTLTQFSPRGAQDAFHLQVRVYDNGSPPLYSDTWITIKVVEQSRHPPHALPLSVTVVSYQDRWPGGELGTVTASDLDLYDTLGFELLPASSLFTIDPQLGVIGASSGLDAGRYLLNVSVSDGKHSSQVRVEVVVRALWQEDLQHAVSVRLVGVSPQLFLEVEAPRLLGNVSVAAVQPVPSSKYLDVLLIILGGMDLTAVEQLLASLGLKIAAPPCRCKNGSKCRQRVAVNSTTQARVQTNSTVFIAPAFTVTLHCACALGFTGEFCDQPLVVAGCSCSSPQTCQDPPCVSPSCSLNFSCVQPNMTGPPLSASEFFVFAATAFGIFVVVALFVLYRRCSPSAREGRPGAHIKQAGALDKLDITQISSGSYCQQDILAGISLHDLPQDTHIPAITLSTAEPDVMTTSLQREEDVESYGFPSHKQSTFHVT